MGIRQTIVIIYDRLTAIVGSCDLEREICQTFQIVPRRVVRTNERMNAWNSRARRVAVRPSRRGAAGPGAARWMFI